MPGRVAQEFVPNNNCVSLRCVVEAALDSKLRYETAAQLLGKSTFLMQGEAQMRNCTVGASSAAPGICKKESVRRGNRCFFKKIQ